MDTTISPISATRDVLPAARELQVSGLQTFSEDRWRDCVLYFLNGMWSDKSEVIYRPKLNLGEITLRFDDEKDEYFAYGRPIETEHPAFSIVETLTVSYARMAVEQGLARFVRNDRLKLLVILLRDGGEVRLWKKQRRSRFGITCKAIPRYMEEVMKAQFPSDTVTE